jgi:hypothetical protein
MAAKMALLQHQRRAAAMLHQWHRVAFRAKLSLSAWSKWWRRRLSATLGAWRGHVAWKGRCKRLMQLAVAGKSSRVLKAWRAAVERTLAAFGTAERAARAKSVARMQTALQAWIAACAWKTSAELKLQVAACRHQRGRQLAAWSAWKRHMERCAEMAHIAEQHRSVRLLHRWQRLVCACCWL